MTPRIVSCALLLVASPVAGVPAADTSPPEAPRLVLVRQHPAPVLTTRSPGAEGIRYGFEGGRVVKVGGTYHLFTGSSAPPRRRRSPAPGGASPGTTPLRSRPASSRTRS